MEMAKEFQHWLVGNKSQQNGRRLSETSAYKYSLAIHTISKDMMDIGVLDQNLYSITLSHDLFKVIERIKDNDVFNRKNRKGHNMYSVAIHHYLDFIKSVS